MIERYLVGSRMIQAVVCAGMVHIAGQVADDRKAGIEGRPTMCSSKIEALLAGWNRRSKLVAVNIFLPQISDFEAMNSV